MLRGVVASVLLLAALSSGRALAQEPAAPQPDGPAAPTAVEAAPSAGPSEEELAAARALFGEGLELLEELRWQEAADRFQQVLKVRFSAVVAYNLAFSLSHMGRLIEAADLLRPITRDMEGDREARLAATALLAEIDPKIGSITVHLSGPVQDTEVYLDDRKLPAEHMGRPLRVDPGEVSVRVERDGEVVASRAVMVGGEYGTRVGVTLDVPPRPAPAPAQVASLAPSAESGPVDLSAHDDGGGGVTEQWWFWTLGGGVVVIAAAVVVALAAGGSEKADPVQGDIGPGVVTGTVLP